MKDKIMPRNTKLPDIKSVLALAAAAVIFVAAALAVAPERAHSQEAGSFTEYEKARVTLVLSDDCEADPASDGAYRGEQLLLAEVRTGRYKGETLQAYNYVSPLFGGRLQEGDRVCLCISTYADGMHTATVYEYDRSTGVYICIALFFLATVLVGGRTGIKSLAGLVITILAVFYILLPGLLRGLPTAAFTFAVCAYITAVCMIILGGMTKKTLTASLGTLAGIILAMLFAFIAQKLTRMSGLRYTETEPLLQMRQSGVPIGLKGLLTGSVIISSLGAVMDVAMSIASALTEIHSVDPALDNRALFRSGMNIGRDMVGTMTNTLILAFLGSSFVLMIYLYSLELPFNQLMSSSYVSLELIGGLSGSIGIILSVPLTALIGSILCAGREKKHI